MGIESGNEHYQEHKKLVVKPKENKTIGVKYASGAVGTFESSFTIRADNNSIIIIPVKVQVLNPGVNFLKDFLDFGVIYKRWVAIFFEFSRFYEKFQGYAPDPVESLQ